MSAKSNKRLTTNVQDTKQSCVFCKSKYRNKYWLGKRMTRDGITAHYYCLLFAPALEQKGTIDQGFKGFLPKDIMDEVKRGARLRCSYCGRNGAVIGCSIPACNVKFHLNCGIVNNSFHSFHEPNKSYPSFCSAHRPSQKPRFNQTRDELCLICRDQVLRKPTPMTLWSPCCGNWLHRECVVRQAYHAGKHHFKCPKCNDNNIFVHEMKKFGVNVPTKDATWEKGQAYQQMYNKNYVCSSEKCQSRKGKDYNGDHEWELLVCDGCGSNCIHIKCGGLNPIDADIWFCEVCKPVVSHPNKRQKTQ